MIIYQAKCEQYLPEESNLRSGEYTIHQYKTILWPSFKMTKLQVSDVGIYYYYYY